MSINPNGLSIGTGAILQVTYNKHENVTFEIGWNEQRFLLPDILINEQPAKYVKGFKAKIMQENSILQAKVVDGKLHLFSNSWTNRTLLIRYKDQEHSLFVSSNLKMKGLYERIETELGCSYFTLYDQMGSPKQREGTIESLIEEGCLEIIDDENSYTICDTENADIMDPHEGKMGLTTLPFVNFNEEEMVNFNPLAPPWRMVAKGLNLEGKCSNPSCDAFNKLVCIPLGTNGTFNIHEQRTKAICPMANCYTRVEKNSVTNCYFWDCIYEIEGLQEGCDQPFYSGKKRAPHDQALSFAEVSSENQSQMVNWDYLKITVTPPPSFCLLF